MRRVKEQGKPHTQEELKELMSKNMAIVLQLGTIASDIGLVVLSLSMFSAIVEGFAGGAFVFELRALNFLALALGVVGFLTILLVAFALKTKVISDADKKNSRMNLFLFFAAFIMPFVAACAIVAGVMLPGTAVEVPQLKAYFVEGIALEQKEALEAHLPNVYQQLQALLVVLAFSWTLICKKLGGAIIIASKFLSMITWVLLFVGGFIIFAGVVGMNQPELAADPDLGDLMVMLCIIGGSLTGLAVLGIVGMMVYKKVKKLGKILLRIFNIILFVLLVLNIMLFAVVGYYVTQIDELIDRDWDRLQEGLAAKRASLGNNSALEAEYGALLDDNLNDETKEEFVEIVKGSFHIMMLSGVVVTVLLLAGVLASHFLVVTSASLPSKGGGGGGDDKKDEVKEEMENPVAEPEPPEME